MGAFTNDGGPASTQREEELEVKPEVTPEVTPEVKPEVKPEVVKPVVKPEVKKVVKPESQAEIQPEVKPEVPKEDEPVMFDTDVPDVKSDGEHHIGNTKFPVFKVGKNEFYQNMNYGRKRLRFNTGSNAQQYMSKTKYTRPFFISYTDSQGKTYTRRVK